MSSIVILILEDLQSWCKRNELFYLISFNLIVIKIKTTKTQGFSKDMNQT
jgi:hypothetical protein